MALARAVNFVYVSVTIESHSGCICVGCQVVDVVVDVCAYKRLIKDPNDIQISCR